MARALLYDIQRGLRDLATWGYVAKKLKRFRNSAPPSPSRLCPRIFVSNCGPKKKYSDAESIMPLQNTLPLPNFNMLGWNCIFEVDNATPFKRLEIQQGGAKITFHKSAAVCIRQPNAFSLSLSPPTATQSQLLMDGANPTQISSPVLEEADREGTRKTEMPEGSASPTS